MSSFNYIRLGNGTKFDYLNPDFSQITIEEIAHSLANQCRYIGHTKFHYSIAQHSVYCSYLAPEEYKYAALMHDICESIAIDVPSPLKKLLPDYQQLEQKLEKGLWAKFGLDWPMHPEVKDVDTIMLATELKQLMPGEDYLNLLCFPADLIIEEMTPKEAKKLFLDDYYQLVK